MTIIAEIAQAHDGSLGIAHSYIDALAKCGVDVIKFQTHIASAESSEYETFRIPFSIKDKTRYDYWKRMEFSIEEWAGLKKHCEEKGIEFLSSPFSVEAVELLNKLEVKRFKIGSGEINNYLMIDAICNTGKPIIISTGMSDVVEAENTIKFIRNYGNHVSVMQCTTSYPTKPSDWGLEYLEVYKSKFGIPVGFSDHSGDIYACLAATALGAEMIEFHAVFDKQMFGPDATSSLEIKEISKLVNGIKQIRESLSNSNEKSIDKYDEMRIRFGKSLAVRKDIKAGDIIKKEDLESKKPGDKGIPASDFKQLLEKRWNKNLKAGSFIQLSDIENE